MPVTYNPWLICASIAVAIMASYTALDLARRLRTSSGRVAIAWLAGGAFAMGTGIWSMHFLGMLAFRLPIPMAYRIDATVASLCIAIGVSAFALYVVRHRTITLTQMCVGGVLMGLGITAMHYSGMLALDMAPAIEYDVVRVLASVLIAILAAMAALYIALKLPLHQNHAAQASSAVVMGLAISGMHYTGMSAAHFSKNTVCLSGRLVDNTWLGMLVVTISVLILAAALLLSIAEARYAAKAGSLSNSLKTTRENLDQVNEQLRHLALHDALTNLPNRTLLEQRVAAALEEIEQQGGSCALMFLDLDRFKLINDSLGHKAGDQVLQEAARRIRSRIRHADTVARLGGDEFVVLVFRLERSGDAATIAQKLIDAFNEPMTLHGAEVIVSVSIGISIAPEDGRSIDELMSHADVAMYQAKRQGRNSYQFFSQELNQFAGQRLALESSLRSAVAAEQFELWYQPKISLSTGRVVGVEALIRWRHPERGLIPPSQFIPLAEETGLITQLGAWVIRTACRQNRVWRDAGLPPLRIAVNVSAAQFRQPTLPRIVMDALSENDLPADALELEVTESVVMSNPDAAAVMLEKLRGLGLHISIDDFGTGYSSLSYLKKFPIDTLKVDRSFIKDVVANGDDAAIVKAIVALAQSLKLRIVAEGVEDKDQLAFLNRLGCDEYQGFLFSAAVPAPELALLLRGNLLGLDKAVSAERPAA